MLLWLFPRMDRYIEERLKHLRKIGVKQVKPVASGRADECAICRDLSGTIFAIEEFPEYPPAGCACEQGCGCVVVRVV